MKNRIHQPEKDNELPINNSAAAIFIGGAVMDITSKFSQYQCIYERTENNSDPQGTPSPTASLSLVASSLNDTRSTKIDYESNHVTQQLNWSAFFGHSLPGTVHHTLGGVGRNMAEAAFKSCPPGLENQIYFIGAVGDDNPGNNILYQMQSLGMNTNFIQIEKNSSSAIYNTLLDARGEMITAVADMSIHKKLEWEFVKPCLKKIPNAKVIVFDGNICLDVLKNTLLYYLNEYSESSDESNPPSPIYVVFEPTSGPKCTRILDLVLEGVIPTIFDKKFASVQKPNYLKLICTPNTLELDLMCTRLKADHGESLSSIHFIQQQEQQLKEEKQNIILGKSILERIVDKAKLLLCIMPCLVLKMGSKGVLYLERVNFDPNMKTLVFKTHHESPEKVLSHVVSVTGAGDTLCGSIVSGMLSQTTKSSHSDEASKLQENGVTDCPLSKTSFTIDSTLLKKSMKNASRSLMSVNAVADELIRF